MWINKSSNDFVTYYGKSWKYSSSKIKSSNSDEMESTFKLLPLDLAMVGYLSISAASLGYGSLKVHQRLWMGGVKQS
jgi:hypothetical protein